MIKLSRGERFQEARLTHNKNGAQTMDEVSKTIGIKKSMLSDLENDDVERDVKYSYIVKLSHHYGVSADYLLGFTEDPCRTPSPVDTLGLSVNAVNWLKMLTNQGTADGQFFAKRLSILFENENFQVAISSLVDYFDVISAENIDSKLLELSIKDPGLNKNVDPYPNANTYQAKLKCATEDTNIPERVRSYLRALLESCTLTEKPALFDVIQGIAGFSLAELMSARIRNHIEYLMEDISNES